MKNNIFDMQFLAIMRSVEYEISRKRKENDKDRSIASIDGKGRNKNSFFFC